MARAAGESETAISERESTRVLLSVANLSGSNFNRIDAISSNCFHLLRMLLSLFCSCEWSPTLRLKLCNMENFGTVSPNCLPQTKLWSFGEWIQHDPQWEFLTLWESSADPSMTMLRIIRKMQFKRVVLKFQIRMDFWRSLEIAGDF